MQRNGGKLVVVSGPSGAGKGTLVRRLFEDSPVPLKHSVSATTRRPRTGETDGVDYHFLEPEEFGQRREQGEFLESFQVQGTGHWYGTLKSEVLPSLAEGKWVILEIDVQGALAVSEQFPEAITIFVRPPSLAELEQRLRRRGTETDQEIRARLEVAEREMQLADRYRYQVVNDDVDRAVTEIRGILAQEEG